MLKILAITPTIETDHIPDEKSIMQTYCHQQRFRVYFIFVGQEYSLQ